MSVSGTKLMLGVTGHRLNILKTSDLPALRDTVGAVLVLWEKAVGSEASTTLVSALAEGADRVVASAGLERGWPLRVPLPFTRSRYLEDFKTTESRAEFKTLCERAERVWVVNDIKAQGGYEELGHKIVQCCDGLLAVWNGGASGGAGGTADVVKNMLLASKPVIWIDTEQANQVRFLAPEAPCTDELVQDLDAHFTRATVPVSLFQN